MAAKSPVYSRAELDRLNEAALTVLERVGVVFHSPEALDTLARHGAKVDGKRAHIGRKMVETALKTAPAQFKLEARNPDRSVIIGQGRAAQTPGYGAPFMVEADGKRRPANLADYHDFCRLTHTSPQLDVNGFLMVEPGELDPATAHRDMLLATMTMSDKPFMSCPLSPQALKDNIALANILFGGDKAILDKPVMFPTINPLTPLQFAEEMAQAIILHAQWGQPVAVTNVVQGGSSGPIKLAGVMALQAAEVLAGLVLCQAVRPGTPFLYGNSCCSTDMATGSLALGGPETAALFRAGVQLAHYYGLPSRVGGALTDAYAVDFQAGVESTLLQLAAMGEGTDLIVHAAGIVGSYAAMSFEKYLADEELMAYARRSLEPIEFTDDTLSLAAIEEVGPGGHYLTRSETVRLCRTEYYRPRLFFRGSYGDWDQAGRPGTDRLAAERLEARLASYVKPDIDPGVERDMERYVEERR